MSLSLIIVSDATAFVDYGQIVSRTLPNGMEVLVREDHFEIIRQRPDYQDMLGLDIIPDWLQ